MYDGDKVLATLDDNLPILEIDENYSFQNINNDFHFLVKVFNLENLIKKFIQKLTLKCP